jgi:hypothetical protein
VTIPQIFTQTRGPITVTTHGVEGNPKIVPVRYVFVKIIIESETYHIYKAVLLTIKVAARNASGASNS